MLIIRHTPLFFFISFCSHANNSSLNDLDSFKISAMSAVTMESVLVPRELEVIVLVNVFVAVVVAMTADVAACVVVIVVVGRFPLLRGVAADVRDVLVIFKADFLLVPKIFRFGFVEITGCCDITDDADRNELVKRLSKTLSGLPLFIGLL